jgi:hypothetical protein
MTQYFTGANDPYASYYWPHSGSNSASTTYMPSSSGTDTLIVMAMNGCDTISDTLIITVTSTQPAATSICAVSVVPGADDYVIGWDNFMNNTNNSYEIYKEVPFNSNNYSLLATQSASVISLYVDTASNAAVSPERYQVVRTDVCGGVSVPSTAHVGVSLTTTPQSPQGYQLNWTAYQGATLFDQYVYRGTSASNMAYLAAVGPTATSFTDTSAGSWLYVIEVIPNLSACYVTRLSASSSPQTITSIRSNISPSAPTGIISSEADQAIGINPNPGDGLFQINFAASGNTQLRVFNVTGQEVHREQFNTTPGAASVNMNLGHLAPGLYMIQLNSGDNTATSKLIIRR